MYLERVFWQQGGELNRDDANQLVPNLIHMTDKRLHQVSTTKAEDRVEMLRRWYEDSREDLVLAGHSFCTLGILMIDTLTAYHINCGLTQERLQ